MYTPTKEVIVTAPGALLDNVALTCAAVDCRGYSRARFLFIVGAIDAGAFSVMKLTECDTSGGSYSDITGAIFGTSTNIDGNTSALPTATDDNTVFKVEVDLHEDRKRFIKPAATAGNGTNGVYCTIIAQLFGADESPGSSALQGCSQVLEV